MRAPQMFSGLMNLARKAGYKMDATTGKPVETTTDETDRDDEPPVEDAPAGDPPAEDAPAGDPPAGDQPGDEADDTTEGEGDEDGDAGTGEDAPGGAGTEASGDAPKRSADFLAGQRYGAEQTAGRWAAVLASPVARGNLEMATDLLASSAMSPAAIVDHCDKYKGSNAARALLDTTQRPDLGASGDTATKDAGAEARANATAKVNAGVGGGRQRGPKTSKSAAGPVVRRSRRAAAADASTAPAK